MPDPAVYARNMKYAVRAPSYITKLDPTTEAKFQDWVKANKVPFDASPQADYDMRGFYQGLMKGDPNAQTGQNANDGQLHYSDYWKTPYHQSFSKESQWATNGAPAWNDQDQLVLPDGTVVFDERQIARQRIAEQLQPVKPSVQLIGQSPS